MKHIVTISLAAFFLGLSLASHAQVPVQANPNQRQMLASGSEKLAANKRLVYDFWREVLEGGHLDLANKYLAASYIQHNPNVPTGRAGFVEFFSKFAKPAPIADAISAPLVAIVAEDDLVVLSFAQQLPEPGEPKKFYTTTWFDMFRVQDGMITEHWDPTTKAAINKPTVERLSASTPQDSIRLDLATLQQYVGKYRVFEVVKDGAAPTMPADWAMTVTLQNDQLVLEMSGAGLQTAGPQPFLAKSVDEFFRTNGSTLNFKHGGNGAVTRVILTATGYTISADKLAK